MKVLATLLAPRGDAAWTVFLRGTALLALALIPLTLLVPAATPLLGFVGLGLITNSPISPLLPCGFEPLIMEAATHSPILLVTAVGLFVSVYMELLNCYTYRWLFEQRRLDGLVHHRHVVRAVRHFARAPFAVVVAFAFTPLPFWVARALSVLNGYPLQRHLVATALGRTPRIFLVAWLGARLQVPPLLLLAAVAGASLLAVSWRLLRRRAVLPSELPAPEPEVVEAKAA